MIQIDPWFDVVRLIFFASFAFCITMIIICLISSRRTKKLREQAEEAGVIPEPIAIPPSGNGSLANYWACIATIIISIIILLPLIVLHLSGSLPQIETSSTEGMIIGAVIWVTLFAGVIPGILSCVIIAERRRRRILEVALGIRTVETLRPVSEEPVLKTCYACGAPLKGEEKFCGKCGIALPETVR